MSSYDINKVLEELSITTTEIYNDFHHDILKLIALQKSTIKKELAKTLKVINSTPKEHHEFYYGEMDKNFSNSKNNTYNYLQESIYKIGHTLNKTGMDFVNKYLVYNFDDRQLISQVIWKHQDAFDALIPSVYTEFETELNTLHMDMCKNTWENPVEFQIFLDFISKCSEDVDSEVTTLVESYELMLMELQEKHVDETTFSLIDYTHLVIEKLANNPSPLESLSEDATSNYTLAYTMGEEFRKELSELAHNDLALFTDKGFKISQDFGISTKTKEILLHNYTAKLINSISYLVEFLTFEYCDELISTTRAAKDLSISKYLSIFTPETFKNDNAQNIVCETAEEYMKPTPLHYISSYKTLNRLAEKNGYSLHRVRGSHAIYKNHNGIIIPIPQHKIGKGLSIHIQKSILGIM